MSSSFDKGLGNDMCMGDDSLSDLMSNQGFRPSDLATLAEVEQKQESGHNVIVPDTVALVSKSTVEKVKKVRSSTKQKPLGEEASKQEQIEEFLKKYKPFTDVRVKVIRQITPLLCMEVYKEKYGPNMKKVKGLWEKRPDDWPADIPFADPNNRLKNEGEKNVKPKKELLGQMLKYLVDRYTIMKDANHHMPNVGSLKKISISTMEDHLSGGINEELVEDGPDIYMNMQLTKQMQPEADARPPVQVVDEEDSSCMKDWNSLEEIRERTRLKLGYLKMKMHVPEVIQLEDLLTVLNDSTMFKLHEKWCKMEICIDSMMSQQPCIWSNIIQNLQDELMSMADLMIMDFMSNTTLKCKENATAYDEQTMDLPTGAEDPQQINSLLNIQLPHPGPEGGMVPFPSGNQLEVHYRASNQPASNNGCGGSMLSDNHKPVQSAQEDGDAQKAEETLISSNESFCLYDDVLRDLLSYLDQPELSVPVQESAPAIQSASQLVGKVKMPMNLLQSEMTSVSVQPWIGGNPAPVMSVPRATLSSTTAVPPRLMSNSSVGSPSTAVAEECMNRLSLSTPPAMNINLVQPPQPLLDQLLRKPRAVGRPGGKRSYPYEEDEEMDEALPEPVQPAPAYNMTIPLMVEEMSNNLEKPVSRPLKKKK